MFNLKEGDIFTFKNLPSWVEYDSIYFIVKEATETTEMGEKTKKEIDLDLEVIVEFGNHMEKGETTGMTLTEHDINQFKPYIITEETKIAKLLLME